MHCTVAQRAALEEAFMLYLFHRVLRDNKPEVGSEHPMIHLWCCLISVRFHICSFLWSTFYSEHALIHEVNSRYQSVNGYRSVSQFLDWSATQNPFKSSLFLLFSNCLKASCMHLITDSHSRYTILLQKTSWSSQLCSVPRFVHSRLAGIRQMGNNRAGKSTLLQH